MYYFLIMSLKTINYGERFPPLFLLAPPREYGLVGDRTWENELMVCSGCIGHHPSFPVLHSKRSEFPGGSDIKLEGKCFEHSSEPRSCFECGNALSTTEYWYPRRFEHTKSYFLERTHHGSQTSEGGQLLSVWMYEWAQKYIFSSFIRASKEPVGWFYFLWKWSASLRQTFHRRLLPQLGPIQSWTCSTSENWF